MMRSLESAVSGLKSQQTYMDVIGNNIANVNTAGFKASEINFSDLFYQSLKQGDESINPSQVGYGSQVASIEKNMSPMEQIKRTIHLIFILTGKVILPLIPKRMEVARLIIRALVIFISMQTATLWTQTVIM